MTERANSSERAVILAPNGRDSWVAAQMLTEVGFSADICADLPALCDEIEHGAGLAIIAEEAIHDADIRALASVLKRQPPWSDLPIILMTLRGLGAERHPAAAGLEEVLGNVSFLERPFHPTTFVSMVGAAIRSRRRQYEARKHLEDLSSGAQQLRSALSAGHLGSWTLDVALLDLRASDTCAAHYGRGSGAELSYDEFERSVHPGDVPRVRAAAGHTLRTGDDYVIEYRVVWPDGTVHWVDVRAGAIKGEGGKVTHLVGVSSDITGRKRFETERETLIRDLAAEREALSNLTRTLERRVEERTAELASEVVARERAQDQLLQSQKMESLGQLTGGVAHDFNNLLMAVIGNLQLLAKHATRDARAQHLIDGAMQGAERGASLTQRMLAFARQQNLQTSATDLSALVTGMRDFLERTLGPQIALTIEAPPGLPLAQVDANQVELAILNLAINARDAMPKGGPITIRVSKRKAPALNVASGPSVQVQVIDSGAGMDPETLRKAIDPFFSTKPPGKGTGLGLSMVHGLARQLGGALELTSEVGKGATATLSFPLATEAAAAVAGEESAAAPGRHATILVVDDDALIGMSTADMLEDLGHTVLSADSGPRALEILATEQHVDLLLTDQAMPGMTGTELAKIVRCKRPGMPILLATGYADLQVTRPAGLPRLSKPYRQAQLQAEINKLLEG